MDTVKTLNVDTLKVKVFPTRTSMGLTAAKEAGRKIKELLALQDEVNIIFAAAPSQNEFLQALVEYPGLAWERINAFHMDEYIGLADDAPQGFGNFLRDRILGVVPFRSVHYLGKGAPNVDVECQRYTKLLKQHPTDIVCMGIGENGHIAFNDPHVAYFDDPHWVKSVELDTKCRLQQVHDGCFAALEDVPTHALTLTIPALMAGKFLFCMVPGDTKEEAVFQTVTGPITQDCPASILRTHPQAVLYVDKDSGKRIVAQ